MSTVSIVLPNYNHAKELETSLQAAVMQSVQADEIIIIDDASTDSSIAVIEGFAARFPNIKLLRNSQRNGVAKAVSRGLQAATGDYVVLASADEKMLPRMIELLSGAAKAFPTAKLIVSSYAEWWEERNESRVHGQDSELGVWYLASREAGYVSVERLHHLLRHWFVWLGVNTAMFSRAALLEVGGFDPRLRWHSDWFAAYAIAFKYGFVAVPEPLAMFRVSEGSYSARGMRSSGQFQVAYAIQRKLHEPEWRYFRTAVARSPVVLSTFMRHTLMVLPLRPKMFPMLLAVLRWWLVQVLRGRRPGFWARLLHGGRLPQPRVADVVVEP